MKLSSSRSNTKIFSLILLLCVLVIVLIVLTLYRQGVANHFYKTRILIEPLVVNTPLDLPKERESKTSLFYGVNVEMSQLLPPSQNYILNNDGEDLIDIANRLGITMFRITNGTPAFSNSEATYSGEQWESVLTKMQANEIAALILIESPTIYQRNISEEYLDFVQKYIIDSGVLTQPNVYGIDLYNEPIVNDHNLTLLKTAAQGIKVEHPQSRLTVGGWAAETGKTDENGERVLDWDAYGEGRAFEEFIDFYSLHLYEFDQNYNLLRKYPDPYIFTRNFITQVRRDLQTQKPMIIGEFGAANGDAISDQDSVGSPELQANTYAGVYQALNDLEDPQILGALAFQFYQRSEVADAWAIAKNRGNYLYPAAYVLQNYAKGTTDVPLQLPNEGIPTSYLLTEDDNQRRINLKVNDIVGIKLSLNPKNEYKVVLSDDSLFLANQELFYDSANDEYHAVFKVIVAGQQSLAINRCGGSECSSSETVFSAFFHC